MRRREYTIEEMEEKAKQGYFWESDLKEWLHISQVDTEEKARRLLQRRNPIRVAKLAENTCKDIESRLKGFCGWIYNHVTVVLCVTALILLTAFLLPIIHGVSFGTFYYEHVRVNVIMTAMMFIAMTIFISIELKIRKLDLDDATFVLYTEAKIQKTAFTMMPSEIRRGVFRGEKTMLFNISISSLTGIVTLGTIWNSEYLYTSGQIVLTALVVIAFIVSLSLTLFKKSKYIRSLGLFGCLLTNIGFAIYSYCHSVWITITVCLAMSLAYFMWNFIETENVI